MASNPKATCDDCGNSLRSGHGEWCPHCVLAAALVEDTIPEASGLNGTCTQLLAGAGQEAKSSAQPERYIGAYRILHTLGRGGMGEVFAAKHERLHRSVAIKAMPAETAGSPIARERFLREARTSSSLSHPNIITVHDLVTHEGNDYIVMELLQGATLREVLDRSTSRLKDILNYLRQLTEGLAAFQTNG